MAKLVKGPFSIQWGSNPILDVSELGFNYDVATNDYETIQGTTYTVEGAITASVEVTLLASDVASLATIFPQYFVPKGGTLSTGEQVTGEDGAIDIKAAACDSSSSNYNLEITSCNGEVTRLVNARTSLTGVDFAYNSVPTVTVTFRGEPESGQGIIQFFGENAITPES